MLETLLRLQTSASGCVPDLGMESQFEIEDPQVIEPGRNQRTNKYIYIYIYFKTVVKHIQVMGLLACHCQV